MGDLHDVDPDASPHLLVVGVVEVNRGEIAIETNDGGHHEEAAITLDLMCLVGREPPQQMPITLIVPVSSGPSLLRALLTPAQWDAVVTADEESW